MRARVSEQLAYHPCNPLTSIEARPISLQTNIIDVQRMQSAVGALLRLNRNLFYKITLRPEKRSYPSSVDVISIVFYHFAFNAPGSGGCALDTELAIEDQIVASIRRIMRAIDLHSRRLVEEHGLTGPQLATLRQAARLGRTTIGTLARAVHLSQPTVTGILDRLERRKLVDRTRDCADRRVVNVVVTDAGHQLLNRAPSLLQDRFRRELGKLLEWERTMTLAALQRIAEMMDAEGLEASPVLITGPVDAAEEPVETQQVPILPVTARSPAKQVAAGRPNFTKQRSLKK